MENRKLMLKKAIDNYKALKKKMKEEEVHGDGWPEEWVTEQHNLEDEIKELAGASMIVEMYDKLVESRNAIRILTAEKEHLRSELTHFQEQGESTKRNEVKH